MLNYYCDETKMDILVIAQNLFRYRFSLLVSLLGDEEDKENVMESIWQ